MLFRFRVSPRHRLDVGCWPVAAVIAGQANVGFRGQD